MERPRSDLWSVNTSDSILTVRALSKSICLPYETAGDGDWRERQKSALVPEPLTGQPPGRLHQLSYRYAADCGSPAPPTPARAREFRGTRGFKKKKNNWMEAFPFQSIFSQGFMLAWKHHSCINSLLRPSVPSSSWSIWGWTAMICMSCASSCGAAGQ